MQRPPRVVVFDIGNVLLDWDPRHLYRRVFDDHARMEWFLSEVCTPAWNLEQDRGRPFADAVAERIALFPDMAAEIRAYDERWLETLAGAIQGSVDILLRLRAAGVPNYAITNFSAEKFVDACLHYPFLTGFDGVVVSGAEKLIKPAPEIYGVLFTRYGLDPAECVFIDDSEKNVVAAREVGMRAIHFTSPAALRDELAALGFPV
ncbi:HAD family phosphatase [Alsobacter sp. SYSU M60028]|uniref:HAD family phosphatase n=1 Tax=Alsobacter ponti TaxID=2962936 RepID=A0ABT1L9C8_9HYPH|nr:HAD family phosphatase [Alsobacter ponti]MCP8938085.1 HAD family phosphatase [Alsobacter ponti]